MPKLRMPVRYGSEIKNIEFTDFLNLTDTVTNILDFPVGITKPVIDRGIAPGKFLQSDKYGNLLSNDLDNSKHVETREGSLTHITKFVDIVFSQRVHSCLITPVSQSMTFIFFWSDSTHTQSIQQLSFTENNWIPFAGHTLSLFADFMGVGNLYLQIHGFY